MAGSDQSVNLTGMLGQISNTLGSGYQINGKSAGEAMGDNLRNAFKPEADNTDPNSFMNLAMWAERNGRPDEAKAYREQASDLSTKLTKEAAAKKEEDFVKKVQGLEEQMATAEVAGDAPSYQRAKAELQAVKGSDYEQYRLVQGAQGRAEGGLERTQQVAATKKVTGLIDYQERLADPNSEFQGSGREVLSQWVDKQLDDPAIREEYNNQLEQKAKTETMKITAKAQADEAAANNLINVYKEGGVTAVNDAVEKLGTPQAMAVQKQIVEFHRLDEEYATADDKIAADITTLGVLGTTIEELGNSMTPEAVAIFENDHKRLTDLAKSGKLTHAGELHSAVKQLKNQVNQANIARIANVTGQKERDARAAAEAEKRVDMLKVGEAQRDGILLRWKEQINALAVNNDLINPFNNVDPDALPQRVLEEMYRDQVRANADTPTKHWQIDPETRDFVLDKYGMPVAVDGSSLPAPKTKDEETDTPPPTKLTASQQTNVDNMIATAAKLGKTLTEAEARKRLNL